MSKLPNCYRCGCQPCECSDGVTLYQGDAMDVMAAMPEMSVDLVFGSPPYADARTYGIDVRDSQCKIAAERLRQGVLF